MNAITIAAVALAAGWVFIRLWQLTRYMAQREIGHPQYFNAGVAAVCLVTLGACVQHLILSKAGFALYCETRFMHLLPQTGNASSVADSSILGFAESAGIALALAWILPWLFNWPIKLNQSLKIAVLKRVDAFDAIDQMNAHSSSCGVPLALTLKGNKVYIGYSLGTSASHDAEKKWLMLFPLLSGYRNKQSRIDIQTNYTEIYGDILHEESPAVLRRTINQFRVVITLQEVVSVQTFNIDLYYERFLKKRDEGMGRQTEASNGGSRRTEAGQEQSSSADEPEESDEAEVDEGDLLEIWKQALHSPSILTDEERVRYRLYQVSYVGIAATTACLAYDGWTALFLAGCSVVGGILSCHPDYRELPLFRRLVSKDE